MLNEPVDRIIVHAPDKSSGHRKQKIGICCKSAGIIEPVFISGKYRMGERFSRQTRQFSAGILDVFQGKLTQYGGKRSAQAVFTACEYRFIDIADDLCMA